MKLKGHKARRALSHIARGHTLRSASLIRAWKRVVSNGHAGPSVRSWRQKHPDTFKLTRERERKPEREREPRIPKPKPEPKQRGRRRLSAPKEDDDPDRFEYAGSTQCTTRRKRGRKELTREFQIHVQSNRPLTRAEINDAIGYRNSEGKNPKGVRLRVTSWSAGDGGREHRIRDEASYWENIGDMIDAGNYSGTSAESEP